MRLTRNLMALFCLGAALASHTACTHSTEATEPASVLLQPLSCPLPISCPKGLPQLPSPEGFKRTENEVLSRSALPAHRARDVIALEGHPVWIVGRFTYGYLDAQLKGEKVDIYLSQNCSGPLVKIGSTLTSEIAEHKTQSGVVDDGGRIFVDLSTFNIKLPIGRHRALLVVAGDNSQTEMTLDIVKPDTQFVVTDIDGVLSAGDQASSTEVYKLPPKAHADASIALTALYGKGYHILYLSARPEWLTSRSRAWLENNRFPPGVLLTTSTLVGVKGAAATRFKSNELQRLKSDTGITPILALGSKESDVRAYTSAGISPANAYYFNLENGQTDGGNVFTDYASLRSQFEGQATVCPNP